MGIMIGEILDCVRILVVLAAMEVVAVSFLTGFVIVKYFRGR
mgnify:CR=1 FL=1